jgi:serine protease Do
LKVARLGDSDKVQVGEWVIAVGNPYGFDRTVSFGIVSGKGRVLQLPTQTPFLSNFIQTDAAIDPGSSGGPLVNLRGEVIGINSIGYGRGQGFTVPINIAIEVKEKLLATGNIDRGWLGIFMQPLSREFAEYFGDKSLQGILVSDLMPDSPAERAGLLPGDIITSFNGQVVSAEKREDLNQFQLLVSSTTVGSEVSLDIIRDGNEARVKVGVGLQPKIKPEELELEDLGFTVQEITDQIFRGYMLEDKKGVFVSYVEVGGVARTGQLMEADVVKFLEEREVTDLGSFKEVLDANQHKRLILLKVKRGKAYRWVLLNREEKTLK